MPRRHRSATAAGGGPRATAGTALPAALLALLAPLTVASAPSPTDAPGGPFGPVTEPASSVGPSDTAAQRGAHVAAARAAATGIDWGPCDTDLPDHAECGTVTVPVDYADPAGASLELHVSRVRATGPTAERRGALLYNPGGPGGSGRDFPARADREPGSVWAELHRSYDLVGLAPRGVAPSAPLTCGDPADGAPTPQAVPRTPSEADKRRMNGRAAAYAAACRAADDRGLLPHMTTPDQARDLHAVNAALGEDGLSYLGVSYGSYVGAVYATLFPDAVDRMVLDSVVDPGRDGVWYGNNLRQSEAFEGRLRQWADWVARHDATYGLGDSAAAVLARAEEALDGAERGEFGTGTGGGDLHQALQAVVYTDTTWRGRAAALAAYHRGEPDALAALARPDPTDAARAENARAVYTAVECVDAPWPRDWARWDRDHTRLAADAPFMTWENARLNLPCAYWSVPAAEPVEVGAGPADGLPPVLLVQAAADGVTPLSGAVATHRRLGGSSLVVEEDAGQHGVTGGNRCVDRLVTAYLVDGTTPGPSAHCPGRPAPTAG